MAVRNPPWCRAKIFLSCLWIARVENRPSGTCCNVYCTGPVVRVADRGIWQRSPNPDKRPCCLGSHNRVIPGVVVGLFVEIQGIQPFRSPALRDYRRVPCVSVPRCSRTPCRDHCGNSRGIFGLTATKKDGGSLAESTAEAGRHDTCCSISWFDGSCLGRV